MKKLLSPFTFRGALQQRGQSRQTEADGRAFTNKARKNASSSSKFPALLILLAIWLSSGTALFAQSTTITTNFANNNGSGTTTFNLQNTNPYPIIITDVAGVTGTSSTQTAELYYKTTPINGAPGAISTANGWNLAASGTFVGVANTTTTTTQPLITGATFTIPAGATYGIAVSSASLRYSTLAAGTQTLTGGGVNLIFGDNISYGGGAAPTAPTNTPRGFIGSLTFQPAAPCTAPPTAGTTVSSVTSVCPNTNFVLSLSGATGGTGQTYQWQSSLTGVAGSFSNITGATSPSLTTTQTATRFYQAVITCSGQTANSVPVQVTTSATPTSGTFTINKTIPASATNFQSISAAIASIQCGGVNGPIVFNIVSGSSATTPYTEQVVIPVIPGASATNTVTFNGNGNTVVNSATTGDAFKLDGADFIRVNNLTIKTEPTATAGAVVALVNGAENNIFNNNTLTHTGSLTSTATSYGLYVYTGSNNNTFSNNTINGGYYGVYHYNGAASAATALNGNSFTGNIINDPYFYGMYNYYTTNTLLEGNNISRPTRVNSGSLYGIYLATSNTNTTVSKNRIHNTHDVATSLTGTIYGIYTSSPGNVGTENIIKNNVLYNFNNNGGTVYGLYNTGGNNTYYYNNTVSLDNAAFAGSTLRGMYFLSASTNVKFLNNIVSIKAPVGTRHALYLASATISLESNRNDLFAPGGNVGYFSGDKATLADWKAANTNAYDQNSVSTDPIFVNPATGDLHPSSGAVNNIGSPIAAVTDDITGAPRNATTPDPGAYEFTPAANDVGVSVIITPNSGCGLSNVETVSVTLNNFGTAAQSNIPVSYTINGGTPVTQTFAGPLAAGTSTTFTFTTKANLATAGTYTIVATTGLAGDAIAVNDATTKVISSIPNVTTFPYFENFETSAGGWVAGGSASTWAWGTPAKTVINAAASGTKAWITGLTAPYNASENSYVVGPCFNFSTLTAPIFEMKAWWNAEFSWDGAVLQSSIDGGTTWQKVGAFGDPNNWYTDNTINGAPGGQPAANAEGWSGRASSSNGSNGYVPVKHALTGLGGQSSVMLRIAFGSDASGQDDGFAFDDISIYQTPSNDVELVAITAPISSGCGFSAAETVTVTIKNNGTVPTPSFPVTYQIGTGPVVTENVTTPIAAGATVPFSFTTKANFSVVGTYNLTATTALPGDGLASNNSKTKVITVVPTISTLPYSEGFENGAGGWVAGGTASSWALGTPAKPVIIGAAGGTKAWVTSLTSTYNSSENSFVQGPCFNFTGVADPDFEMKAWWNSEFSWDGAVLQSSIDGGTTWQNVGAMGDPNNWYTDNSLNGAPGGQPAATAEGWSGRASTNNGSNGWVKVKHKLTGLGNKSSVLLRIAFGSDASINDDGFAFDDIRIGDNTGNLAVNSFVPLTKICGYGNNEKVEVVLENLGSVAATGFTVSYTVDGGTPVTVTYPGSLAAGSPTNFIFPVGANLSGPGAHTIVVTVNSSTDPDLTNNSVTYTITNALFPSLPINLDFETATTGVSVMRTITRPKSNITENVAASSPLGPVSTKGMIMDGIDNAAWTLPAGIVDPWTNNPDNFSAAYICFSPAGGTAADSLYLTFDLKQLFKTANANTNFRVTVDGVQVGPTYRPPFSGTPIVWQKVKVNLYAFKNQSNIQIGLESSVKEAFAAGAGTANLLDNIRVVRRIINGTKDDILASGVTVYPNPSTGIFNVSLPSTGKHFNLEVTDLTGKVIKQQTATAKDKSAQLKLNTLAQGVYLLKVTSDEASTVRRIVIQ